MHGDYGLNSNILLHCDECRGMCNGEILMYSSCSNHLTIGRFSHSSIQRYMTLCFPSKNRMKRKSLLILLPTACGRCSKTT